MSLLNYTNPLHEGLLNNYQGRAHIHVTLNSSILELYPIIQNESFPWKFTPIDLITSDGEENTRQMMITHHFKVNRDLESKIKSVSDYAKNAFKERIIRIKCELDTSCDLFGFPLTEDKYLEVHWKFKTDELGFGAIKEIVDPLPNVAFSVNPKSMYSFLNFRFYSGNYSIAYKEFKSVFDQIKSYLISLSLPFDHSPKPSVELAVMDTNISLDKNWM